MTSFQVEFDGGLPQGLCRVCSESAIAAINFRQLCKEAIEEWNQAVSFMSHIQSPAKEDTAYYLFYNNETKAVISDRSERAFNKEKALHRLNTNFEEQIKEEEPVQKEDRKIPLGLGSLQCPDCKKKFAIPAHLNNHLKNSTKVACSLCGLVLLKRKLASHLSKLHNRIVYPCEVCYQIFESPSAMDVHVTKTHGKDSYHCKVCGNAYTNERGLGAHMYSHSLFSCNPCGLSFDNRKCYVYHKKQCVKPVIPITSSTKYICDHCGSCYSKKPSLRIHIIQKHLHVLPYVCDICGKRTSTITHLKSHEKVHTIERKTFQCRQCGAKLRTELGFQLHQRIHTGERPYECEDCGEKFLSSSRRLDHIKRRHRSTKDMAHGCTMCTARFVRPFELKKHYASVHAYTVPASKAVTES